MLLRAIALSLALLVGIGTIVPLATQETEAGPRKKGKKRHYKKYKKYSKRWWRQYRARIKRQKAIAARKRALRLRQLRLAKMRNAQKPKSQTASVTPQPKAQKAVLPTGDSVPNGWKAAQQNPAELQFRVDNSTGAQVGTASIAVVGPAGSTESIAGPRSLAGVSTSALRREVIDRMVRENGWVVNDYKKEVAGQQVYVVEAQSQARNGSVQARMFYFTEVDGKIYSVATNSPLNEAERLAEESEKVINSLKSRVRPGQRASLKE